MQGLIGAPSPAAPRAFTPPTTAELRLSNGMRVIVAPRHGVPLIGAQLLFNVGAASDPMAQIGQSYLAASLLSYGPEESSSDRFAAALDAIGARFGGGASYDAISAGISAVTHLFPESLKLCNQAIRTPAFTQEDLNRVRTRTLSDLRVAYGSANALSRIAASRAFYGNLPYGQPVSGVPESLEGLTREAIVRLARTRLRPETATVVFSGDIEKERAFEMAEQAYGTWQGPSYVAIDKAPALFEESALRRGRVIVIDLPDSGRSSVIVGRVAISRRNPRYSEGLVTMGLLSGYSGRLNHEVRVKRGLSYGASAQMQARREPGPFYASTLVDHAKVAETIDVILDVIGSVAAKPPTELELAPRKAMLRGSFGRALESVGGLASSLAELALNDLPLTEYSEYLERIDAVTPKQVANFARDYLLEKPTIVVVGDASIIVPALSAKFPEVEEYSASKFDVLAI